MRRSMILSVLAATMLAFGGVLAAMPRPAMAATKSVTAWIGVSAMKPAVGCPIDITLELRSKGQPVVNAEVEVALHTSGDVVSADYGATNGSGIAFFALDTSASPAGVGHWMDINVGGEYFTGFSVVPSSSGDCETGGELLEVSGEVNVVPASQAVQQGNIWVPTYVQQRNLSCEYAALYIATSAWGAPVSEYAFDNVVGWSANPHWGYRGDINGLWGRTDDYGVYAEPLSWALSEFGFVGDVFYGVGSSDGLKSRLDAGIPVLVWLGMWGDQSIVEQLDGATYTVIAGMHVMVAYGYDASGVYLSDPGSGTYRWYSWGDFMWMWNVVDGMALGVTPA